ncbi:MAG: aldehyde dehydrogenase family protein [Acidobacteriaceae bacterium]
MNKLGLTAASLDLDQCHRAQYGWAAQPLSARLAVIRRFRHWLAAMPAQLTESVALARGVSSLEALTSEVMPLADACRWLEANARGVLAAKRAAGSAPLWMRRAEVVTKRDPIGLVLVIAPGNYPLFLAGVQVLQALVAGNAVLLKPAPGATQLLTRFRDALLVAGLSIDLLTVLREEPECVQDALFAPGGPDHVILTGSARTGRAVQQLIADAARPIGYTAELSGADVCIALPGARLDKVAQALRFATNLNRGRTCIAPRIVLVPSDCETELADCLRAELANLDCDPYGHEESRRFAQILSLSVQLGAELLHIENSPVAVLRKLPLDAEFPWEDLFSPALFLVPYRSLEEAVSIQRRMPQALSAAVFGDERRALKVAGSLDCGCVTINDLVAPTADPRVGMTARKGSGVGTTRGADGLLAMTTPKTLVIQRSRAPQHWRRPRAADFSVLTALMAVEHSPMSGRWSALRSFASAALKWRKH